MIDFFVPGKIWDHFEEQQGCQWNPEALAGDLRACLLAGGETERARPGGKGQNIDSLRPSTKLAIYMYIVIYNIIFKWWKKNSVLSYVLFQGDLKFFSL